MRESGSGRPCAARSDEGLRCFVMAVVSSLVFDVNVLIMKDFFFSEGEPNSRVLAHIGDDDVTIRINTDAAEYTVEVNPHMRFCGVSLFASSSFH